MDQVRIMHMIKGTRPLVRPWHRLEDDIKMDLREIALGRVAFLILFQNMSSPQSLP